MLGLTLSLSKITPFLLSVDWRYLPKAAFKWRKCWQQRSAFIVWLLSKQFIMDNSSNIQSYIWHELWMKFYSRLLCRLILSTDQLMTAPNIMARDPTPINSKKPVPNVVVHAIVRYKSTRCWWFYTDMSCGTHISTTKTNLNSFKLGRINSSNWSCFNNSFNDPESNPFWRPTFGSSF